MPSRMFRAPENLTYDLELAAQPRLLRGSETGPPNICGIAKYLWYGARYLRKITN